MIATVLRTSFRFLIGPGARTLIVFGLVAAAWAWWSWAPLRPLAAWTASEFDTYAIDATDASTLVTISPPPPVADGEAWFTSRGPVRLWDLATGRQSACIPHDADKEAIYRHGPDGDWLLIHGEGQFGDLSLWDPATGQLRARLRPDGKVDPCFSSVSISPDNRLIAGDRPDGQAVRVWEAATGRMVAECVGARGSFAFTPDGRKLLSATVGNDEYPGTDAKLWDLATGRALFTLSGHDLPIGHVAVSPDGRWLATGAGESGRRWPTAENVKLWDAATGRFVADIPFGERLAGGQLLYKMGGADFSPDSRLLVARGWGRRLVWDISESPPRNRDDLIAVTEDSDGEAEPILNSHHGPWYAPDGHQWFVMAPKGQRLLVGDVPTAQPQPLILPTMSGAESEVNGDPIFGPKGQKLAVSLSTEAPYYPPSLRGLLDRILRRPPGTAMLSVVRLYDPATGGTLETLPVVVGTYYQLLTFTPDGRTFWTHRLDGSAATGPGGHTRIFEQWPVPPPGPPWWLLVGTTAGVLLVVADWWRSRRRRPIRARWLWTCAPTSRP